MAALERLSRVLRAPGRAAPRRPRAATARALACVGLLAALLVPAAGGTVGQEASRVSAEYDLKAAFLFNFTQFVEWPPEAFPEASTPITIGILGDDPFGRSLDEMVADEVVRNRKLLIRRFRDVAQVDACHVLFVSPSETRSLDRVLAALDRRSILTVGENPDFVAHSGIVAFVLSHNRLRLRINLAAARAARLTISSKLLRQAQIVGGETPGP